MAGRLTHKKGTLKNKFFFYTIELVINNKVVSYLLVIVFNETSASFSC